MAGPKWYRLKGLLRAHHWNREELCGELFDAIAASSRASLGRRLHTSTTFERVRRAMSIFSAVEWASAEDTVGSAHVRRVCPLP